MKDVALQKNELNFDVFELANKRKSQKKDYEPKTDRILTCFDVDISKVSLLKILRGK
ncbi:hypothetical protein GGQ84_002173 [Desulfitispora alkaliphila]|uniref:hypothetical protein n=1 Tax=Desulfitispora alkaliphila TaxID=622674 RepID=UPI003D1B2A19